MEWVKLGEIAEVNSGGTPRRSNNSYWKKGNIPWIKISDMKGKYINSSEEFITESGLNNSSARLFKEGTILYTIFATIGEVSILKTSATTNQAIAGINIINDSFNIDYIYYYLLSIKDKMKKESRGVAQNNINLTILKNLEVPFIVIEKQKEIVDVLNGIENLIRLRKEQIQAYDDLIESLFFEMFGDFKKIDNDKKIKISDIATVRSSSRVFKKDLINKGIPFYRGQEIGILSKDKLIDPDYFISEELYNEMSKKSGVPKIGDLLLPSIASEGQIWIVNSDEKFYFKDGRVLWINIENNKKINSIYFKYILRDMFRRDFDSIASGTTFKELKIFLLKELEITYPPIEMQNNFADYVLKIEEEKKKLNSSLAELEDLFNALMQDAFSGNLFKD